MRLGYILWSLLFAVNGLYSQNCFIPNNGQIHNQNGLKNTSVQYVNYGENVNFHLTNGGFNYELVRRFHDDSFEFYRADVAIRFQGKLNTDLEWEGKSTAQKWFNFYNNLGSFENIEGFNSVEGKIGKEAKVEFSSSREALVKYDIHCKVKDLPSLEFVFDGPDFVEVDGSKLTLKFDNFDFVDEVTKSYTMDGQEIRVVWEVINEHTVGFRLLDKLDPETRITIDPSVSLKWATYFGDNSNEQGYGTASTQDGNAVFCGRISSRSMATSGTHQSTIGGSDDAFLVKMHKEGGSNSRLWATYFGGSSVDYAHDVFVSSTNAILLTGRTSSSNAIAKNARYKSSRGGKLDAFFAKFTDSGTLDWANYLGGSEDDVGLGIATDSSQNVLVVGYTESSSGIASRASRSYRVQQWSRGGNKDGFLGKFDKDGRRLFVTYFGGSGADISNSVICTLKDTIVFVGETNSSSITSSSTSLSGRTDGFITKLDPNGRLSRFIYVGDTLDDVINKVRYFNPNVFVVGTTNSTSNISLNGHQNTLNKGSSAISTNTDAFVMKYSSSLKKIWGTYYGGDDYEWGNDLATDIKGYVYLLGTSKSYNSNGSVKEIIATKDAFIEYLQGGTDAFLVKFDQKGKRIFSTYFGSLGNDYGNGLSHGRYGDVYICGETNSNRNLVFRPYQSTYGGSVDAFFADLYYCNLKAFLNADSVCLGETLSLSFADSSVYKDTSSNPKWGRSYNNYDYTWYRPGDTMGDKTTASVFKVTQIGYADTGVYTVVAGDSFGCVDTTQIRITSDNIYSPPDVNISSAQSVCQWDTLWLTSKVNGSAGRYAYNWYKNGVNLSKKDKSFIYPAVRGKHDGEYVLMVLDSTDKNSCYRRDTIEINIGSIDVVDSFTFVCPGDTVKLFSFIGDPSRIDTAYWAGPNNFLSATLDTSVVISDSSFLGDYLLYVADSNGCKDTFELEVLFKSIQTPSLTYDEHYCENDSIKVSLSVSGGNANSKFSWSGPNSYSDTSSELGFVADTSLNGRYKVEIRSDLYCPLDTSLNLYVTNNPKAELNYDSVLCVGDTLTIEYSNYIGSQLWLSTLITPKNDSILLNPYKVKSHLTDSGEYHWSLVDTFACRYDSTFKIHVVPYQTATLTYEDHYCEDDSIKVSLSVSGGNANSKFSWSGPRSYSDTSSELGFVADTSLNGRYKVEIRSDLYCPLDTSLNLYVTNNPKAELNYDSVLCVGDTLTIEYSNYIGSQLWLSTLITPKNDSILLNPYKVKSHLTDSGEYHWSLVDTFACRYDSTFKIHVVPYQTATLTYEDHYCEDDSIKVSLSVSGGNANSKFSWSGPRSYSDTSSKLGFVADTSLNGRYKVGIRSDLYCPLDTTLDLFVTNNPRARLLYDSVFCLLDTLNLEYVNYVGSSFSNSHIISSTGDTIRSNPFSKVLNLADSGLYHWSLVDTFGCQSEKDFIIDVNPNPVADFEISSSFCANDVVVFKNASSGRKLNYTWHFDSTSSVLSSKNSGPLTIKYSDTGVKNVRLIASSSDACSHDTTKSFLIHDYPRAKISSSSDTICFRGNKIDFVDSSTYAGRSRIVKSTWFYDSATTKANRDTAIGSGPISIEYSSLGKKDIKLIVLDGNGCSDTTESDVFVLNHPKARIHSADTNLCKLSNLFLLTDTSSKTDLSVSKWNWDFDANHNPKQSSKDTSRSKGPHKIKYSDTGEYRINLVISDLFGCNDTASVTVYVHSEPISITSRFDSTGCVNKTRFDISNQSTIDGKAIRNQKWYLNGVFMTADTLFSFIPKRRGPLLGQLVNTTIYGCADTTDFTLLVDTLPDLLIESDTQCISGNLFRFENVANNYSQKISKYYWSFGDGDTDSTTINQAQKSYDSIGVYTVTLHAVTPFGCRDTTQQDIIIGKDPLAGIAIIQDLICHNTASAELQAYGLSGNQPFRYYWYGDTNLTDTRIKGRGAGSHFVIVKDRFNCFDTAELLLIQPDSLRMELNSSSVLCRGGNTGSASAFVDGGVIPYTYKWNIPRAQYVDTLEGLIAGIYNVTVTDQKGCVIRDSIKVFEPDSLKISIQLEQPVLCSGDKNAILDAVPKGGIKPYQYSINFNSYASNGTFDSLGAGIYSIRIIDKNGCKNEDTITVMQPLPLSSTVTIDSLVCFGDSTASIDAVVKGGNLPYLYTWEHEGRYIGGDSFIDNLPANEYLFKVKDRYGCALERRVKVSSPLLFQGRYEYERNVCEGSETKFVSFNAPDRTIWTKGLNNYRLDSLVFQDFSFSDTGYYMLRMYNESGCLYKDSFRVDVFPGSVVSLDTVVCEGTPYRLKALNSISTSWVGPNNDLFNGSVVFKQEAELSDSGQYFAFTQSPYGCKDTFVVNLDVRKLPWLSLSPYEDKIYCEGDRLNFLFRSSEPVENIWYGPQNNKLQENTDALLIENLTLEDEGTYTVTVKTAIGCIAQVDTVVRVGEIPEANLRIGPNECIMANTTPLQFVNVSNDYFIEKLYLNDSLFSSQLPFSAIPKRREDLDIKLVIVNSEGCSDSAEYTLPIQSEPEVYVPNSFTPNGDLTNPLFLPYMNESISQFKLSIYNRWGEKIFEQEGDNLMNNIQGWDGTFEGDICTEGVYIYILQYSTNCKEKDFVYPLTKKGWLYLLR